jgi:hypothetical protein
MSSSYSISESKTFTLTHAKHLAAKVATDLKRVQRLYGGISDARIGEFEGEATELLRLGYLESVTYGFKRDGKWIEPTLRYTAKELADGSADEDPGRIRPGANVAGANFSSWLTYTVAWYLLSTEQQDAIESSLPLQRTTASEPQVEGGYFANDQTYSSGGRTLARETVRSY